jgi:fumarate hydratase class I
MITIHKDEFISSIADALQHIACYHSVDFLQAMHTAYHLEQAPAARNAIAQVLINSRLCATHHRPICQDTGVVVVFIEMGTDVHLVTDLDVQDMVNMGVQQAYQNPRNPLRASMVNPPYGQRQNTQDNTPAIVHVKLVAGDTITVHVMAKGGGSENKARLAMLNPNDDIVTWVVDTVASLGAGWCPPGLIGLGIGGTAEQAMLLARQALLEPIDIQTVRQRGAHHQTEALRLTLYDKINALGIGAQGLGGLITVLDVKICTAPTHAASLPVALLPNCTATRHIQFTLNGQGPAYFEPPALDQWPELTLDFGTTSRRVNIDNLTHADIATWRTGEQLLLTGHLLTARDAAHQRLLTCIASGQGLPPGISLQNRFIYYVGPVDPVGDEIVGPAGPTTATRMDRFTRPLLEHTGLLGMIGKAERSPETCVAIRDYGAVYLIAVGGAAYLVAQAIKKATVLAFPELGMEAIREFQVVDMPVTVAVDSTGQSIHQSGPALWRAQA